jgi:hypothetical protein
VAADDGVDAVLAVTVPTAMADAGQAVSTARVAKPLAAVLLDQPETVLLRPGRAHRVPAYAYPESAARALAHAVGYHAWRVRQQGHVPELAGVRAADASALVSGFLDGTPGGGWLPGPAAASLLACYEIPLAGPGTGPGRQDGVEVLAGVVQEPVFGPLVVFGLGGAAPAILGARAARLSPLTDADAAEMIRGVSGAELLLGPPAGPAVGHLSGQANAVGRLSGQANAVGRLSGQANTVDVAALAGLLLRVSRLADDLPEVAELELSPVIASPGGVSVRAARIRVSPVEPQDPFLRRLR